MSRRRNWLMHGRPYAGHIRLAEERRREARTMTAEQKLGVGIIGIGWVAHEHIKAWNNNPSCAVVALASHSQDNAAAAQQQHGLAAARIYTDWTDLIRDEQVDVVD